MQFNSLASYAYLCFLFHLIFTDQELLSNVNKFKKTVVQPKDKTETLFQHRLKTQLKRIESG